MFSLWRDKGKVEAILSNFSPFSVSLFIYVVELQFLLGLVFLGWDGVLKHYGLWIRMELRSFSWIFRIEMCFLRE